jgi:hypothetical protein
MLGHHMVGGDELVGCHATVLVTDVGRSGFQRAQGMGAHGINGGCPSQDYDMRRWGGDAFVGTGQ